MKNLIHSMLSVALIFSMVSIALARGEPAKQKAFTTQSVASVDVTPVVASVPPMTVGYDVICNLATLTTVQPVTADTSANRRQSTTVAEPLAMANGYHLARSGPSPALVLLA